MAEYTSFEEYEHELRTSVKPYRALVSYEVKSADFNKTWLEQDAVTGAWDYARQYECSHIHRRPVRWVLSNGVERVALQCVACGDKESNGVRKGDYPNFDELPELDEDLIDLAYTASRDFREQLYQIHEEVQEQFRHRQSKQWWAEYDAYLQTPKWYRKRSSVLERDEYVCQACMSRPATQAHHLTYEHVFDEPLFDLVAVCATCHEKLHPHMKEARHAQAT